MKVFGFGYWDLGRYYFDGDGGGAGAGAGAGGDGGGAGAGGTDDKVTLTKAELDGRIAQAVALATKKAKKEAGEDPEIKALRDFKAEQERKELERKGEYEKALASQRESLEQEWTPKLTAEQERGKKLETKLRDTSVGLRLSDAAGKLNAVNPAQVRQLLDRSVRLDDNYEPVVVDDAGNPRFVAGKPMTPDQLVKEFLDANPHMVRAGNTGDGGGASGGKTLGDGAANEIAAQEAKITELTKKYNETRDTRVLTQIRLESEKLTALKAKGKAA